MTESVLLDTSTPPTLPPSSHLLTPRPRPQGRFDWEASGFDRPPLLSYGPCQFPTLGLIVQVCAGEGAGEGRKDKMGEGGNGAGQGRAGQGRERREASKAGRGSVAAVGGEAGLMRGGSDERRV